MSRCGTLSVSFVLHFYSKKRRFKGRNGAAVCSVVRSGPCVDRGPRTDSLYLGPVRVSQLLAGISCIAAIVVLVADISASRSRRHSTRRSRTRRTRKRRITFHDKGNDNMSAVRMDGKALSAKVRGSILADRRTEKAGCNAGSGGYYRRQRSGERDFRPAIRKRLRAVRILQREVRFPRRPRRRNCSV